MPKITMPLKVDKEVKEFLEEDSIKVYGKQNLNKHAGKILKKYMETRKEEIKEK